MFEDSMFESRVGQVSSSKRWTTLASVGLQVAVAGLVIALPLWHPEALPFRLEAPKVLMPLIRKAPLPVVQTQQTSSASSMSIPVETTTRSLIASMSRGRNAQVGDAPALLPFGPGMGDTVGVPIGVGPGPTVTVASVKPPARIQVSTGVLQGMLIAPIRPVYPFVAKAAGVQGSVVVEAIISRTGTIESLRVVSGPEMLRAAAIDAIREARYQPYRLNGEPVDVETRITVNFRMGG
jgi:protein TonB